MSYHGVEYTFQKEWMEPYPAADFGLTYVCGLEIEEPTGINLIEYLEEHPSLELFYAPWARVGNMDPKKTERDAGPSSDPPHQRPGRQRP